MSEKPKYIPKEAKIESGEKQASMEAGEILKTGANVGLLKDLIVIFKKGGLARLQKAFGKKPEA